MRDLVDGLVLLHQSLARVPQGVREGLGVLAGQDVHSVCSHVHLSPAVWGAFRVELSPQEVESVRVHGQLSDVDLEDDVEPRHDNHVVPVTPSASKCEASHPTQIQHMCHDDHMYTDDNKRGEEMWETR